MCLCSVPVLGDFFGGDAFVTLAQYNKKIAAFSNAIHKSLENDFPDQADLLAKFDNSVASAQFAVLGAFLTKGFIDHDE